MLQLLADDGVKGQLTDDVRELTSACEVCVCVVPVSNLSPRTFFLQCVCVT